MPPKIVVVGSYNTDLVTYMPRLPQIGETVPGHRFATGPGGKGSNQAVAAARLGAQVMFVGRVGQDNFANVGLHLWEQEGIDTAHVLRDPQHATGIASIFVDDEGENMIALALGANMALSPEDVNRAEAAIAGADVLITQLEIKLETVTRALQLAQQHGVKTILNPAPGSIVPRDVLALADYLTPNEPELEILLSKHSGSIEDDARSLLVRPGQTVIVTMGAWGAIYVNHNQHGHLPAYSVEAVDTVGGGDAFTAGLGVAVGEKRPLLDAIAFASGAAAVCVTRKGASESMPRRAEVESLMQDQLADQD